MLIFQNLKKTLRVLSILDKGYSACMNADLSFRSVRFFMQALNPQLQVNHNYVEIHNPAGIELCPQSFSVSGGPIY
ncbi:hypothetical protein H671_6g16712 [Cricetulus griseus]|nr:hypothetical protein H671_6g16712 [Cricetulus griseus]